jgi:hypothetical protein
MLLLKKQNEKINFVDIYIYMGLSPHPVKQFFPTSSLLFFISEFAALS